MVELPLFLTVGLIASFALTTAWLRRGARIVRALRRVRTTPIGRARDGVVVKVVGTIELADAPLIAPLSGRPCVYYQVVVEQYGRHGRGSSWSELAREQRQQDFWLRDDSGRALVRMEGATVAAAASAAFRSHLLLAPPPAVQAFLAARNLSSRGLLFNKTLRCSEALLAERSPVAVGGLVRLELDPDPASAGAYRSAPERRTLAAAGEMPLLVSNHRSARRR